MSWPVLIACLAVVAIFGAVAVFVRVELEAMARRAWHRIACAWMQYDEVRGCCGQMLSALEETPVESTS